MKTVYTRPICPACSILKAQLNAKGEAYKAIVVLDAKDPVPADVETITREAFQAQFPNVRSFPHVVE